MNLFKVKIVEVRDAASELLGLLEAATNSPSEAVYDLASGLVFNSFLEIPMWVGDYRRSLEEKEKVGFRPEIQSGVIREYEIPSDRKPLKQIIGILRLFVKPTKEYSLGTILEPVTALNLNVGGGFTGSLKATEPLLPELKYPIDRILMEKLIQFLLYFVKDTNLQKYKPIGCCPNCDGIFLIRKRGQRSCSSTCYQKEWIAAKMKVDPRYFANKARDNRLARKKLATKKAKQKK